MHSILKNISCLGIPPETEGFEKRRYVLTNWLSVALSILFVLLFILSYYQVSAKNRGVEHSIHLLLVAGTGIICIILNRYRFFAFSKLLLAIVPAFLLLLYPVVFLQKVTDEFFFWYPYAPIGFSVVPHVIFSFKREKLSYIVSFGLISILVLTIDQVILFFAGNSLEVVGIVKDNYLFYKVAPVAIWIFVSFAVIYLISLNRKNEISLQQLNKELADKATIIEEQSEEIHAQNFELKEQKEELESQNEELSQSQEELAAQNDQLNQKITELKEAQAQLIESEKMASLGLLTAGIAHEINNPINYISSSSEGISFIASQTSQFIDAIETLCQSTGQDNKKQLLHGLMEKHEIKELISGLQLMNSNIQKGVARTSQVIDALKSYSHGGAQTMVSCQIHEIVDAALVLIQGDLKKDIKMVKVYGKEVPPVQAHENELIQVFLNLLNNALQAIEGKGEIKVETLFDRGSNTVRVVVKDNGKGITDELKSKIFQPFFTTKEVGKGTGLGLYISYQIISRHNGTIEFSSLPGKGSIFQVILPNTGDVK